MICTLNRTMVIEIGLRIILWILFCWLDAAEPFFREIQDSEIWNYQYPATPSYISAQALWVIIILVPLAFLALEYFLTRNEKDIIPACLGLTLAYGLNGVLTSYIKIVIGRPRPDFYFRCFPDGKGEDYMNCVGDKTSYMDGRKSFPSGHASFGFCCMTFISWYLARKLSLFQKNFKGQSWQLCLCIVPLIIAFTIAASRTCDYHHHYEDVAFGALLGTIISYICYNMYFPKVSEIETVS